MKKTLNVSKTIAKIPLVIVQIIFYLPIQFFKISIWQRFLGHDIFISYARADGFLYANVLANLLGKKGYTCFIDQWENEPGVKLSGRLISRLENTRMLVLLGTDGALFSRAIEQELEIALKRNIQIMPIDFGNAEKAIWYPLIKGLPISKSQLPVSDYIEIHETITERITNSFKHVRRLRLLKGSYLSLFVLLFVGYLVLIYMFDQVDQQKKLNKEQFDEINEVRDDYFMRQRMELRDKFMDTSKSKRDDSTDSWTESGQQVQKSIIEAYQKMADYYKKELKDCNMQLEQYKKKYTDTLANTPTEGTDDN